MTGIQAPEAPFDLSPIRDLYPWTGKWVERDGLEMHYLDEGTGPPMIFVHGNPTWSFYYRRLITQFSDRYRCIAPDHIGMGLSAKPSDEAYDYTLASRVADLDALIDHLGIEGDITLVLHDWGGMIGLTWAMQNLGRVRRIVLSNTSGFRLPESTALPWQLWLVKRLPFAIPVRGFNAFVRGATRMCSTRKGRMTSAIRRGYLAPYDSWAHRISVHRFVQDIPLTPTDPAYESVCMVENNLHRLAERPVLIVWGERDFVFIRAFLETWEERLPSAEVHRFPDCGHYLLEDAPDEVIEHMEDFFDRHPVTT